MRQGNTYQIPKRMPIEEKTMVPWSYSLKADVYNRLYCFSSAYSASSAVNEYLKRYRGGKE